jgi:hypothetical protein
MVSHYYAQLQCPLSLLLIVVVELMAKMGMANEWQRLEKYVMLGTAPGQF